MKDICWAIVEEDKTRQWLRNAAIMTTMMARSFSPYFITVDIITYKGIIE